MVLRPGAGRKNKKTPPPSFCLFLPSRLVQCVDMNQLCDEPPCIFCVILHNKMIHSVDLNNQRPVEPLAFAYFYPADCPIVLIYISSHKCFISTHWTNLLGNNKQKLGGSAGRRIRAVYGGGGVYINKN